MVKDLYILVGRKLSHSFSAEYFNEKFEREDIPAEYRLVEFAEFSELHKFITENRRLKGFNVTIPYKTDAYNSADILSPSATAIGAVNAVKVIRTPDGGYLLSATNTDAPGFAEAVRGAAAGKRYALVLGTGGASKAVCHALGEMGIAAQPVSRKGKNGILSYRDLTPDIISRNLLIINTTPLGMSPDTDCAPPIPYELLTANHFCFDLVYNPEETLFMKLAAAHGAGVSNGLQMLHNQAELAWEFWQLP